MSPGTVTGRRQDGASGGGFSLVELLVVITILAMVTGVVAACLSGGIRVWEQTENFGAADVTALTDFAIMERDLMNATVFIGRGLTGSDSSMSFPGVVPASAGTGRVARLVEYRLERVGSAERLAVVRRVDMLDGTADVSEAMFPGLNRWQLSYAAEVESGEPKWESEWNNTTNLPARLRIEVVLPEVDEETRLWSRVVYMTETE